MLGKKSFAQTLVMYFITIAVVVISAIVHSGGGAFADEKLICGDYEYTLNGDYVIITNYLGNEEDVVIPNNINGKTVACIQHFNSSTMTSVDIPNTVKSISDSAFRDCKALEVVIMNDNPDSTFEVSIGKLAFSGCEKLKTLIFSENVSFLGSSLFSLTSVDSIIIPKSVKKCDEPFDYCYSLTTVIFEEGTTDIPDKICCSNNIYITSNIKTVILPDSVTSIGDQAFYGCRNLEKINIPASVTKIGSGAFEHCEKLKELELPEQLTTIEPYTFSYCTSLQEIHIPNSVTSIGERAFFYNCSIEKLDIPDSVEIIGNNAFSDCSLLKKVCLPDSLTQINDETFSYCSSLTEINIPVSVSNIGERVFYRCDSLSSMLIPKSVTSIGNNVFNATDNITLYVYEDSYAETYADEHEINYIIIGDADGDITKEYFKIGIDNNNFAHFATPLRIDNTELRKKLVTCLWDDFENAVALSKHYGETAGICHGMAVTMCYGNQGLLDFNNITSGAYNYWTLGNPYVPTKNNNLKDIIVYYHLLQALEEGKPTDILYNIDRNGSFSWPLAISQLAPTIYKKTFFEGLIKEAKRSAQLKKPFILSYNLSDTGAGHSLIVCGYKWNDQKKNHEIKIYDLNSYGNANMYGKYYTFSINESLTSFEFRDFNAEYGKYNIQDKWLDLKYYGIDKLYGNKYMVDGKYFAASTADKTTTVQVSAYKKFRLENAKGEYLAYDGENYSGNMKVYDCYTYGLDDSLMWNITVAESTEFKLTKAEDGCQLIATIGGQGYAVTANGADKVSISSAGISASGANYTLDTFVQSKNNDIIRLQAEADGKTSIKKNGGKIVVNSDSYCKDMTVCRFSEGEKEEIGPSKVSDKKTEIETGEEIVLPFTDVKKRRWFYEYVEYVYKKGIMTGLNATTFGPEDNITRAMVVTVLWRMADEPEPASKGKVFPDVPTGKWYSKAVAWAKENKIVGGYSTGLFGTDDNIIRQDFVKILKGYTDYIGAEIPTDTFESYTVKEDAKDVSGYAREYVQWAFQRSIIGQGSGLNPKGFLTRAETATMIMRFEVRAATL